MTVEQLLAKSKTETIGYDELRAVVADRKITGGDVLSALSAQQDRRRDESQKILDTVKNENRDLLASESRTFDKLMREASQIGELFSDVERRNDESYRVPPAVHTRTTTDDDSVALRKDQSFADFYRRKGGTVQQRLGHVIYAWASGTRKGLTDLELRSLSEGSDPAGGFTVTTPLMATFIDRLRNETQVLRAGAMFVPMDSQTLSIARLAQPGATNLTSPAQSSPLWKSENELIDESVVTLERVVFTARTLPILFKWSIELDEDSLNIGTIIEREMIRAMALELDRAALLGSGTPPEPKGVANQSGVTITHFNAVPGNLDLLLDGIGTVWANNAEPNGILYNAEVATFLAKLKVIPYSAATEGWPLIPPPALANVPVYRTNQIPMAGTSPDSTQVFIADWTQLMIGMRTGFRLEMTREGAGTFERLQVAVRAYLRADIQLAHPEAFCVIDGVRV